MKKLARLLGIVLGCFLMAVGVLLLIAGAGAWSLIFLVSGGAFIAGFYIGRRNDIKRKAVEKWAALAQMHPEMLDTCLFKHVRGLSVNQYKPVDAVLCPDKLVFETSGRRFELPKERIVTISCYEEVQNTAGSIREATHTICVDLHFVVYYHSQQGELQAITLQFFGNEGWRFANVCNAALIGSHIVL